MAKAISNEIRKQALELFKKVHLGSPGNAALTFK